MGQFKPMVKMMTTEPSIELKLKKGGHVAMPKMKSKDNGTGSKKMATGGLTVPRCGVPDRTAITGGVAPSKPTMSQRRKAMMGRKMAEGGDALKKHAALPASKAHKGLKTGGVAMGQGGYKNGGSVIPVSASKRGAEKYDETLMHTAKPDHSPAKTGGVKNGNGGGYKKGGNVKKMGMGGSAVPYGPPPGVKESLMSGSKSSQLPPPSTPRTGGGTTKPAPTMKDMIGKARTELVPKKPTVSGADYDKYMPRPRGPQNPGPMPLPRRGSGPNDAGRMPTEQDWKNYAATAKYSSQAAMDAGKKDFMSKPLQSTRKFAKGGGVEGNVSSSRPGVTNTTTGEVRKGNAGGFKKGGALKKFARGGSVNDSGKAVAMPQGYKKPPTPVSINQLSGTYKKGGKVRKYAEGGPADIADEKKRKAMEKAYEDSYKHSAELERAMNPLDMLKEGIEKAKSLFGKKPEGESVTKTRESVTVTPTKKRYGGAC